MTTIVRRFQFCAGHRIFKHEGKCAGIHGHNYVVQFYAAADALDEVGRVIDFGVLKDKLGGWLEAHWDHAFICYEKDEEMRSLLARVPDQHVFVSPVNPTAENLARYLLDVVGPQQLAGTCVQLTRVVLWETENCRAEATR